MRSHEFESDALRNHLSKRGLTEEQINEIIPALVGVAARGLAGAAARGLAKTAGRAVAGAAARGLAKTAGRVAGRAAAGALGTAARAAGSAARVGSRVARSATAPARDSSDKSSTSKTSTSRSGSTTKPSGTVEPQSPEEKRAQQQVKRQLRPGGKIKIPTADSNRPTDFTVKRITGQDVEIENPKPKPGEPKRFVYDKGELTQALQSKNK